MSDVNQLLLEFDQRNFNEMIFMFQSNILHLILLTNGQIGKKILIFLEKNIQGKVICQIYLKKINA